MSFEASKVAQALNLWSREGLDMMGGTDGKALGELLNEFLVEPGSETLHQAISINSLVF